MQQVFNEFSRAVQQGVGWLLHIFQLVWNWSFGQVFRAFRHVENISALPVWKQIMLVLVALAIGYLIFVVAMDLWNAIRRILAAIVDLLRTILDDFKYVVIAGVVAFGGAWAVNNLNVPWLP